MVFNSKVLRCRSRRKQSKRFENTTSTDNVEVSPNSAADAKACCTQTETPFQVAVTMARDRDICVYAVKHHYPPIDSCIEDFPPVGRVSLVIQPESRNEYLETSSAESSNSSALRDMHISARLMEEFMVLAGDNTSQNLETCGVLGAFLKNGTFYVTTLIIPKQETTAHSVCRSCTKWQCQALNEEEIHAILDGESLFPAGWIHNIRHSLMLANKLSTTLYSDFVSDYWVPFAIIVENINDASLSDMLPIVNRFAHAIPLPGFGTSCYQRLLRLSWLQLIPQGKGFLLTFKDLYIMKALNYGIFRLTNPGGIAILKECKESGFHSHPDTSDGSPLFECCSNIYINHNLRLEIIDLRSSSPR
ncbi:AMSH-like ubiquitin thioesterase 2 [Ananas comosus]|uniref:AMSH-like ubiquitin thioesterase 2 n=1 Tax=Ananas comosus TaxID=4615 RepID=A0A199VDR4_ANACO|nr:AMSH-like ubiquitin thioesterase 2 [Ananas comosus]